MKKTLFPEHGNFYKANLHMHTTISDGKMTPEEVKREYKAMGYSVVAFTDHDVMVPHIDLKDDSFLPITSHEIEVNRSSNADYPYCKTYHLNFYSKKEDLTVSPAFLEEGVWAPNAKPLITAEQRKVQHERVYSSECVNDIIEKANQAGFLVSYNHPVWSCQNYDDYKDLKGVWGVELYNTGCAHEGYFDTTEPLMHFNRTGSKVFPLATDDAHAGAASKHDCFGGWVMISADKLEYNTIMQALENGDFYASTGPEIKSLSIEDGKLTVTCSEVSEIHLITERRWHRGVRKAAGESVSCAEFDIKNYLERCTDQSSPDLQKFIRIEIIDKCGNRAYSRCYYPGKDF